MKTKKLVILIILLVLILIITLGLYQFLTLKKAHSSFENYYTFRGCIQLLEKSNTYGICKTSSGQIIKIVQINNKWYLDGDGPGTW